MNDLRERIAQAIRAGIYRAGDDATDDQTWLACADAVIAEFGFRVDQVGSLSRYVSRWCSDDAPYCIQCGRPHGEGECLRTLSGPIPPPRMSDRH